MIKTATEKGREGEDKATFYLINQGFHIYQRNVRMGKGEIDIIATKEGVFHFIEVKSGKGFEPVYNLTPQKITLLIRTLLAWRQKNNIHAPFCLDAIIITPENLRFIPNITL